MDNFNKYKQLVQTIKYTKMIPMCTVDKVINC